MIAKNEFSGSIVYKICSTNTKYLSVFVNNTPSVKCFKNFATEKVTLDFRVFKKGLKPTVQYGRSSKVDHLEEKLDRSFFIFDETMR